MAHSALASTDALSIVEIRLKCYLDDKHYHGQSPHARSMAYPVLSADGCAGLEAHQSNRLELVEHGTVCVYAHIKEQARLVENAIVSSSAAAPQAIAACRECPRSVPSAHCRSRQQLRL